MNGHVEQDIENYRRVTLARLSQGRWYPVLACLIDTGGLVLALQLTVWIRLLWNPYPAGGFQGAEFGDGLDIPVAQVLALWVVVAALLGLYRREGEHSTGTHLFRLLKCTVVFVLALTAFNFYENVHIDAISRVSMLIFGPVSLFSLMACHYMVLIGLAVVPNAWTQGERILVVAPERRAQEVVEEVHRRGGSVVRVVFPEALHSRQGGTGDAARSVSDQLGALINELRVQRIVIVGGRELWRADRDECVRIAGRMGVPVGNLLDSPEENLRMSINFDYGLPMVEMSLPKFSRVDEVLKRAFDLAFSLALTLMLSPVLLAVAVLIKATSRGPVFYVAPRVGRGGRHFPCLKFRTMVLGVDRDVLAAQNEKDGALFKIRQDPRVTAIGRVLRRFSIDELPQLFNVIAGHMSLVGPRPLPVSDLDPDGLSRRFPAWAEQRARVLPGITGLWQVSGRSDLAFSDATRLDMEYVREWSLALDIQILLTTPIVVLTGRGAS